LLGALADARDATRLYHDLARLHRGDPLLASVRPGTWPRHVAFVIANAGFELGYVFYNGFLPETPRQEAKGAGYGWAAG
jgi:hypothetical protein